jgi:hypothetical protein
MANCVVCLKEAVVDRHPEIDAMLVNCSQCGGLQIDSIFFTNLPARLNSDPLCRPRVKHWLRKRKNRSAPLNLDEQIFQRFASQPLPTPREQADALIRVIGDELREKPGTIIYVKPEIGEFIGAIDDAGLYYIFRQIRDAGFAYPPNANPTDPIGLTFMGWERYEELLRSHSEGPVAFMAMPFNNLLLDYMFDHCFRRAVEDAGFRLYRIIDNQGAGVIDDQLRVEIRKARFLISDITDGNLGAYWEAGFAEGLGKPVIYTCKTSVFNNPDPKIKPHFDTNHCVTVLWEEDDVPAAAKKLTATIRATLPSEAKMGD